MNILLFSGSLRKDSLNKKLIAVAENILSLSGHTPKVVDLKNLALPVYDGDIEAQGMPANVSQLGSDIQNAEAIIISSPEYNGSIAGSLKNTVDWISRLRPVPLSKKPILLMGASPGYYGSIRALGFTRAPFETLGSFVYPQTFALPSADKAFEDGQKLKDSATQKKLEDLIAGFISYAKKINS